MPHILSIATEEEEKNFEITLDQPLLNNQSENIQSTEIDIKEEHNTEDEDSDNQCPLPFQRTRAEPCNNIINKPTRMMRFRQRLSYTWLLLTSVFFTSTDASWIQNPTFLLPLSASASRHPDQPDVVGAIPDTCSNDNLIGNPDCGKAGLSNESFLETLNNFTFNSPLYGNETHPVNGVISFDIEWLSVFYEFNITDAGKKVKPKKEKSPAFTEYKKMMEKVRKTLILDGKNLFTINQGGKCNPVTIANIKDNDLPMLIIEADNWNMIANVACNSDFCGSLELTFAPVSASQKDLIHKMLMLVYHLQSAVHSAAGYRFGKNAEVPMQTLHEILQSGVDSWGHFEGFKKKGCHFRPPQTRKLSKFLATKKKFHPHNMMIATRKDDAQEKWKGEAIKLSRNQNKKSAKFWERVRVRVKHPAVHRTISFQTNLEIGCDKLMLPNIDIDPTEQSLLSPKEYKKPAPIQPNWNYTGYEGKSFFEYLITKKYQKESELYHNHPGLIYLEMVIHSWARYFKEKWEEEMQVQEKKLGVKVANYDTVYPMFVSWFGTAFWNRISLGGAQNFNQKWGYPATTSGGFEFRNNAFYKNGFVAMPRIHMASYFWRIVSAAGNVPLNTTETAAVGDEQAVHLLFTVASKVFTAVRFRHVARKIIGPRYCFACRQKREKFENSQKWTATLHIFSSFGTDMETFFNMLIDPTISVDEKFIEADNMILKDFSTIRFNHNFHDIEPRCEQKPGSDSTSDIHCVCAMEARGSFPNVMKSSEFWKNGKKLHYTNFTDTGFIKARQYTDRVSNDYQALIKVFN